MDEIVKAALKKWPNVPHCHGWLALDARGDWYMRDDRVQAAGPFPRVKGSRIVHDKLREFIHRNYAADERGAWFFQNGPQRVYVQIEAAPYVWRLQPLPGGGAVLQAHTGAPAVLQSLWLDEVGRLYALADIGFGLVHSLDVELAAALIEQGLWPEPGAVAAAGLPARFGYVCDPRPL